MKPFILIIVMSSVGENRAIPVGLIFDAQTCDAVGKAFVGTLDTTPGVKVSWMCIAESGGAT